MITRLKYLIMSASLLAAGPLLAQRQGPPNDSMRKERMEELKQMRHDLFVKKLELTETEEKAFFPIFDEYQLKLRESKRAFRTKWKNKLPEDLSESEANEYLKDAIAMREKELELFKTYSEKLKTVIPAKKVVILPRVEREVQRELIDKFRDGKPRPHGNIKKGRRMPPPPDGPPPPDEE